MSTPASTHTPSWCLLRFPLLPSRPCEGAAATENRLLRLAIDYVASFRRGEEHDESWRDDPALRRRYEMRARYRATPFGLFAVTMVAEARPQGEPVKVDVESEVSLHSASFSASSGRWLVNPTLTADGGRWAMVRPDSGGITSAPDTELLRQAAEQQSAAARPAAQWLAALGETGLRQAQQRHVLIEELAPEALVTEQSPTGTVVALSRALTEERPFQTDVLTDAYTEVRATVAKAHLDELLAAAAHVVAKTGLPQRLEGVRSHLREHFSGGAVPLLWLLSAPASHPFGSWRHVPKDEPGAENGVRLFVATSRRDNGYAQRLREDGPVTQWARGQFSPAPPGLSPHVRQGMAVGAMLAEPVAGAHTWLRGTVGGLFLGPGSRIARPLGLSGPQQDDGTLRVEISWTLGGPSSPLMRRPDSGLPRLNLNTVHREGDVRLADVAVVLENGRLQAVHRADGRAIEWHYDSPLTLSSQLNPWAVQLLGLLMVEAGLLSMPADPLVTLAPGSVVPRLSVGRCLISRRGVSLGPTHRADLLALTAQPEELCEVMSDLGLGHVIEVTESFDQVMRLDLSNADDLGWLARRLRRDRMFDIHEALPLATPVVSPMGEHVHEIWTPWQHSAQPSRPVSARRIIEALPQPDEEWIGWHVYAPDQLVERWLGGPEVLDLMRSGRLFFIRYQDQRPHLRVRVHRGADVAAALASLTGFLRAASPHHPCEVVPQAWTPEDYRYGGALARPAVVAHFCADSAWWMQRLAAQATPAQRFALAAARLASWCTHLAGDGAFRLLTRVQRLDPALPSPRGQRAWMQQFRQQRHELDTLFKELSAHPQPDLDFLHGFDDDALELALASLMHMSVNRGLGLGQAVSREGEVVMAAARLLKAQAMTARKEAL